MINSKIVTGTNINDFLHIVDGLISAHATLHHTSKTEPWYITWQRWKTKNILNAFGQQEILHIMGESSSDEVNIKIILNTLEDNIPIVDAYINIMYGDLSSAVKWNYHDKPKSMHFVADKAPHKRTLVEMRSRLDDNTSELLLGGGEENGLRAVAKVSSIDTMDSVELIRCATRSTSGLKSRTEALENNMRKRLQQKAPSKTSRLPHKDQTEMSSPSKTSQNDNAVPSTPRTVSPVVDPITPNPQNKSTLKTRIEDIEGVAFGEAQTGLIVARIKEMEHYIFAPDYTPPNNLTSRLDALALELNV